MITKRLYHRNVFWRTWFNRAVGRIVFNVNEYSLHLYESCLFANNTHDKNNHGMNLWGLNQVLDNIQNHTQKFFVFEVETEYNTETHNEHLIKAVIRTEYDNKYDIIIVFDETKIRTAWLNEHIDTHTTLNRKKYYNPKRRMK